jgi:hypothetical protein
MFQSTTADEQDGNIIEDCNDNNGNGNGNDNNNNPIDRTEIIHKKF